MGASHAALEQFWRSLILVCLTRLDKSLAGGVTRIGIDNDVSAEMTDTGYVIIELFGENLPPFVINTKAETPREAFANVPDDTDWKQLANKLIAFVEEELSYAMENENAHS